MEKLLPVLIEGIGVLIKLAQSLGAKATDLTQIAEKASAAAMQVEKDLAEDRQKEIDAARGNG